MVQYVSYVFSQGIAKEENEEYTETTKELSDCLEGETDDIINQIESLMKVVIAFSIYWLSINRLSLVYW